MNLPSLSDLQRTILASNDLSVESAALLGPVEERLDQCSKEPVSLVHAGTSAGATYGARVTSRHFRALADQV